MNDLALKARALESAIFQALMNAAADPTRESYWFLWSHKMEKKFTTEHGRHYSYFLEQK